MYLKLWVMIIVNKIVILINLYVGYTLSRFTNVS